MTKDKNSVDPLNYRNKEHDVNDIFLKRWSPRAMSGEKINDSEIMSLFEAARWAPSSFNNQPWRFYYTKKESSSWDNYFDLLVDGNKTWCKNAYLLIIIVSKNTFDYNGKDSLSHSFDTGSAFENLALQGMLNNLVVHPMQGFDYLKAKQILKLSDEYTVEAMVAIGKPGPNYSLPEGLAEKEIPSQRKELKEIIFEGIPVNTTE